VLVDKPEVNHLEDLGVDGRVKINMDWRGWAGLIWLWIGGSGGLL